MPTAERRLKSYSVGVRVKDAVDDTWEKQEDGRWKYCGPEEDRVDTPHLTSAELLFAWGPISKPIPAPSGFPRMLPDGKTKLMYIPGKTDNTPPTVAELETATEVTGVTVVDSDYQWTSDKPGIQGDLDNMTVELNPVPSAMENYARIYNTSLEEAAEAFGMLAKMLGESYSSPQEELKFRLNTMLQGDDPGQPVNWRGI